MDIFKQVGKRLHGNKVETEYNTRRIAERFPAVEAKVDNIVFDYPYLMEFKTSNHPHSIKLNIFVRPPENCFQCSPGPMSAVHIDCVAGGGSLAVVDGNSHPAIYSGFSQNEGGFVLDPAGGVIVPQDGVYNLQLGGDSSGVTTTTTDAVISSVRRNGVIVSQKVWSVANGRLGYPPAFFSIDFTLWGLCIPCRAGDTIGGWIAAQAAFFGPSNLSATITLVGLG